MVYGDRINNVPKTPCDLVKRDCKQSFLELRSRGYIPSGFGLKNMITARENQTDVHRGYLVALISNMRKCRGFRGIM